MPVDASRKQENFPGGPVVKNPPSYAGDTGSIPGLKTRIQYTAGRPSPRATTAEPTCPRACTPRLEKPMGPSSGPA